MLGGRSSAIVYPCKFGAQEQRQFEAAPARRELGR
jgi:hypothetical protein